MRRLALFAIPFVLLAGTVRAQQVPTPRSAPLLPTPPPRAPRRAAMTPREVAEMRAELMMARKEYAEAAKAYQTILIDDPHNAKLLNYVGMAYQQLGDGEQAEHYYKLAAHADKTSANALNNLGTVEYSKPALRQSDQVLQEGDRHGQARLPRFTPILVTPIAASRSIPKALEVFNRALALDPEVFDHKGNSGSVLQQRTSARSGFAEFHSGEILREDWRCRARRALLENGARRGLQGISLPRRKIPISRR